MLKVGDQAHCGLLNK